jgi:hypothetical protein
MKNILLRLTTCFASTLAVSVVRAPVYLLLLRRCPANVAKLVMPVHIDTVKRMILTWLWPNLPNKFGEGCKAKLDAAATIVSIANMARIAATVLGSSVAVVLGRRVVIRFVAVGQGPFAHHFLVDAAAGSSPACC